MTWTDGPPEPLVVVPYDPEWAARFRRLGAQLRAALGGAALRIDHIGSTAVPGLAAKPVLDVQVSVAALEPGDAFRLPLEALGYVWRVQNPDRTKRYFREPPGAPRTHIHVRRAGSWSEQFALLFRDYVCAHPHAAARYAERKARLADEYRDDREGYVDAKGPFIWETMVAASDWSQRTGWEPRPPEA